MFTRITSVLFLLALACFFNQAQGESAGGTVVGTVIDSTANLPLNGVEITLDGTTLRCRTNSLGAYRLSGIPPGNYRLRFTAKAYDTLQVDGIHVGAESVLAIDGLLCPTPPALTQMEVTPADASTTPSPLKGGISGHIVDHKTGDAIVGASVLVIGTHQGALTNFDGSFVITRVPEGTYTLKISAVGYNTVEITELKVKHDQQLYVSQDLQQRATELDRTITVTGRKDILDITAASGEAYITQEAIEHKPVTDVGALLEQVTGVQSTSEGEVFVRGGRAGEVSYKVDGIPYGGAAQDRTATLPPAHGGSAIVNGQAADAMFFENYGVNPFVDTEDDSLSTFAIDVDDASYVMARNYISRHNLPPKDAIRVEEFVNRFNYEYESPNEEPFAIHIDGSDAPFGPQNSRLLRIGIKGLDIPPEHRKPANLVFVIDVSGSMNSGNRLGLVKQALLLLVDELRPDDRVGIVVYGANGRKYLSMTSIEYKKEIVRAIKGLHAGGSTYAEQGLRLGYKMAAENYQSEKINRIILCSDGVANVGVTGADGILEIIKKYVRKGITLSSIGFGMGNYNDVLLEKLGNKGNGYYAYVDDIDEARRIFVDNLTGTLQVIARDVKIQVEFDPTQVRSYRLLGYENRDVADEKFRDDNEDGGEIGSGHSVTALYELKLQHDAASTDLGRVYVRFKDPSSFEVTEVNRAISRSELQRDYRSTSDDFQLAALTAEFSEQLRESYWARDNSISDVLARTALLQAQSDDPQVTELLGMIARVSDIQRSLAKR